MKKKKNSVLEETMVNIFALAVVSLLAIWYVDRTQFFLWLGGIMIVGVVLIVILRKVNRLERDKLFFNQKTRRDLQSLTPEGFERYIAELYRRQGYKTETVGKSHDGGVDVVAIDPKGVTHYIQCKRYTGGNKVDVRRVREMIGVLEKKHAEGTGIIITTDYFTSVARFEAIGTRVELINIDGLVKLAKKLGSDLDYSADSFEEKKCPKCGNKLVVRESEYGKFLGCSSYPKCKYTEDIK